MALGNMAIDSTSKINELEEKVNSAQSTANSASTAASSAQSTANTAATNAATALSTAQQALAASSSGVKVYGPGNVTTVDDSYTKATLTIPMLINTGLIIFNSINSSSTKTYTTAFTTGSGYISICNNYYNDNPSSYYRCDLSRSGTSTIISVYPDYQASYHGIQIMAVVVFS